MFNFKKSNKNTRAIKETDIAFFAAKKGNSNELLEVNFLQVKEGVKYDDVITLGKLLFLMHFPSDDLDLDIVLYFEEGVENHTRMHEIGTHDMYKAKSNLYGDEGKSLDRFLVQFMETGDIKGGTKRIIFPLPHLQLMVHGQTTFEAIYEVGTFLQEMCVTKLKSAELDRIVFKHVKDGKLSKGCVVTLRKLSEMQGTLSDSVHLLPNMYPTSKEVKAK